MSFLPVEGEVLEAKTANRISLIVAFFQKINFNLILLAGVLAVNGD